MLERSDSDLPGRSLNCAIHRLVGWRTAETESAARHDPLFDRKGCSTALLPRDGIYERGCLLAELRSKSLKFIVPEGHDRKAYPSPILLLEPSACKAEELVRERFASLHTVHGLKGGAMTVEG
jgi:hypothetical protein